MKKNNTSKPNNVIKLKKVELGKPKNLIGFDKVKEVMRKKDK